MKEATESIVKHLLTYILLLMLEGVCLAQTSLSVSDLSVPTKIAPAYFGPNAFPVPDMMTGRTSSEWKLEVYADSFINRTYGPSEEYTANAFVRLTAPLFTDRVNLVIWGPIVEYFRIGDKICKDRRIESTSPVSRTISGDIYISTDFMLLTQERHGIDISVRAALKSASGNDYSNARYYDSAGYFFDAAFGRKFTLIPDKSDLSIAASGGFLCWQTDNGRQNDAVMYGLKASYRYKGISISSEFGGYVGWERDGDAPMTLKTSLSSRHGDFVLSIGHQVGFIDWPFHQFRFGISYIISRNKNTSGN